MSMGICKSPVQPGPPDRSAGEPSGAALPMASFARPLPPSPPLAAPRKGGGGPVPSGHGCFQPADHFRGPLGMLPRQCSPPHEPLHRLRQMQPRAANRRVERQHSLCHQPPDPLPVGVSFQIVPNQDQADRRQRGFNLPFLLPCGGPSPTSPIAAAALPGPTREAPPPGSPAIPASARGEAPRSSPA